MAQRILAVQLGDIGDLILSTPALAALRHAHPDAYIAVLAAAHAAPVLRETGLADAIITFDRRAFNSSWALFRPANLRRVLALRRERCQTVIYFHHFTLRLGTLKFALIGLASGARRRIGLDNGRGWFLTERLPDGGFGVRHQAQYWLDLAALLGADPSPRPAVVARAAPPALWSEYCRDEAAPAVRPPRVVIHAGSGGYSRARRWDPAAFAAVAEALHAERGARIILVGGADDDGAAVRAALRVPALDLTGRTTLPELAGVLAAADLFIGADSGVMHLAAAAGTPVAAVFGPSSAHAWGPWAPAGRAAVVRSAPECSPCSYIGHSVGLREGCPARTCMRLVAPAHVLAAARALLDGQPLPADLPPPRSRFPRRQQILGLPVDGITYGEWLDLIAEWVAAGGPPRHVCTINPEFMMIARRDPNFANILRRADLCVPDGVGLLWAARRRGAPLPERVTGSDGVPRIAARAALTGWRLFLLGAAPGVAERAAAVLQAQHPGLQIAGVYGGSPAPEAEDAIVERVNASRADLLFVAYGAPEQDKWIARNLPRLDVRMAMGVGGAFDFIAGAVPRAPVWMRQRGLEWLYRLYLQPWRLRRMLRLPRFVLAVLLERRPPG